MPSITKIEWTNVTWNPVTGCEKVSSGCRNCYALRFAKRLQAAGNVRYANGPGVTLHWDLLRAPLRWRKPRLVFVNSMSDLFHDAVPTGFIREVLKTAAEADRHTFQILTKRTERLAALAPELPWPPNVWMGVSIENEECLGRIEALRAVPAALRFVSIEPLLGPLTTLDLVGIDWVIVGGESGPGARPMKPEWALNIRDACVARGTPFFFKQWGGVRKKAAGRLLEGRLWEEIPGQPSNQPAGGAPGV